MEATILKHIPCIRCPVQFRKGQSNVKALIDSSSKVNIMILAYTSKLGLTTQKTDVGAQQIDCSTLITYEMVISASYL